MSKFFTFAIVALLLSLAPNVFAQFGSPEGGCICPGGIPATCGGNCPVCPNICPDGITIGTQICNNNTVNCPNFPHYTCVNNGGQGCAFSFDLNFDPAQTWVTVQNYFGTAPACAHTAGAACLQSANTSGGWTPSPSEPTVWHFFAHRFRDCMVAALTGGAVTGVQWATAFYPPIFIGANCNYLGMGSNPNPNLTHCGGIDFVAAGSPISLVLSGSTGQVEKSYTLVNFPVHPGAGNELFTWKASDSAPLLVYDPEHRGVITGADQLFGNWTFGGRKFASLVTGSKVEWRDGYEALGTLDRDGDSKISGEELAPLALWFDSNRNAISEEGEVRPLSSIGISELYYKTGVRDSATGNIVASVGYLREVDGISSVGASVDWYASKVRSIDDAIHNFVGFSSLENAPDLTPPRGSEDITAFATNDADLTGIWGWSVESTPNKGLPGGVFPKGEFYVRDGVEGGVLVSSMLMMGGKVSGKELIAMSLYPMKGTKSVDTGGGTILSFETIETTSSPVVLKSRAVLQPDGKTLAGETTVSGKFKSGAKASMAYQWTARKLALPK